MTTSDALLKSLISSHTKWQLALYLVLLLGFNCAAQVDSTEIAEPTTNVQVETKLGTVEGKKVKESDGVNYPVDMRSPKKASIMSAALPGLGQAYNKKYWKIPILYAGFGVAGWYLQDNLSNIRLYKEAYLAATDGNPETINNTPFTPDQLDRLIDQYTQWRDLSYIAFAVIYILNIVDASVDAHLFYFDVSEDISMNLKPFWNPLFPLSPGLTLTLKL